MTDLSGKWQLYLAENETLDSELRNATTEKEISSLCSRKITATVPGNFELDLMRANELPDLYYGENTLLAQELEYTHLWYCKSFTVKTVCKDEVFRFDGIDTVAEIFLNGKQIGFCDNMFISHEFKAHGLKEGENELVVHIIPAIIEARKRCAGAASDSALPYNYDSLTVRKAAYMYGWDIMPRIVSAGIWKGVYLLSPEKDRIDELYIRTKHIGSESAELRVYAKLTVSHDRIKDYSLKLSGVCGNSEFYVTRPLLHTEFNFSFGVSSPKLWWPRNMGEANLYKVTAELLYKGEPVAVKEFDLGIRTVELNRSSCLDDNGKGEFCFKVNGEPFFALGTNWVPTDAFPSRMKDRLPLTLSLLWDSGCNMVRCWGGGVYEDDEFFEFCDKHGIAVWQDFMMGCAIYPQTKEFAEDLAAEVESVVKRLRGHASIFCWAGDNECDQSWTWCGKLDPNTSIPTRVTIPSVLHVHDPWRVYIPSSPYIDSIAFASGKANQLPEDHLWGPRDYYKGDYYKNAKAVFASETGYHGCPSPKSVEKFISPEHLTPNNLDKEWLVHASSMEADGNGPYDYRIKLMSDQVGVLFGSIPEDLENYALASQISQSEAKKFFIERFRCNKWDRTGILWWNLIDGWPQFSDAVTDWYGTKKLAYKTIRRISAPVCGMIFEREEGKLELIFANEHLYPTEVTYRVFDPVSNTELTHGHFTCPANSSSVAEVLSGNESQKVLAIRWEGEGFSGKNHFVCGKPPYDLSMLSKALSAADVLDIEGF
ncbi:MAG: hypothetical protein II350_02250 [Clostridia bacterium]|nr:hypothetical protein [Clostridia bacterium]